jgi:pimeloyl-ACP methyl ester carboxylesterase
MAVGQPVGCGPVIEQLPEFHCLALDLPQHGRSTHLAFTMQSAAQAAAAVVRQQAHGGTAHIIGLSLGAQVLVALLSQSPEVAASAIISSALLRPLPGASLGLYSAPLAKAMYWSAIGPLKGWDAWVRLNMKYSAGIPDAYFDQARVSPAHPGCMDQCHRGEFEFPHARRT